MPDQIAPVRFHLLFPFTLRERRKLQEYIRFLFKNEKTPLGSMDYIFCSDDYLLKINQDFLKHDFLTDIITFDLSDNQQAISGELYISIERVKDNARILGIPFLTELRRVMFHGALHLCGYKDKSKRHIREMRLKENYYLSRFN
ncbi:MAG: rRNA maturation RNase YbeY [Flavitalea sp.]